MRERRIFSAAAALIGVFGVYWSSTPIYRMESKVGSWDHAYEIMASNPLHWVGVVLLRLLVAALLVWFAFWAHGRRRGAGYAALLFAIPLIWIADVALWIFLDL